MKLLGLRKLDSPLGQALLEATIHTGFSEAVARRGLEAELATWTSVGFTSVRDELSPALPHTRLPETVLVIAARTLAASTLRACLMARLLGARVLLKVATGQTMIGNMSLSA